MATEEQRSIEISYKADLKDLISKLKSIPNVTDAEAKKMVAALDRQVKQAETAAKKSADASKKAAEATSKAARDAASDFTRMGQAADKASLDMHSVAEKSGDIDRGFSGIEIALKGVNPQLAEASAGLADSFAVVESLIMGFGGLNPLVLAGAAAIGALTLGYSAYTASIEAANQAIIDQRQALKDLQSSLISQRDNFYAANDALNAMRRDLSLARGEITQYEYDRQKAADDASSQFQSYISAQEEIIQQRKDERDLVKSIRDGNILLSEDEKNRLKNLQLLTPGVSKTKDLLDQSAESSGQLYLIEKALTENIRVQNLGLDRLNAQREEAVSISQTLVSISESDRIEAEYNAKAQEKINKSLEDRRDLVQEAIDFTTERYDIELAKLNAIKTLQGIIDESTLSEEQKKINAIEERYKKEFENLKLLSLQSKDTALAYEAYQTLYAQRASEIHALEMEQAEERKKAYLDGSKSLVSSIDAFATASISMLQSVDGATEKSVEKLFKLQQAAAVADIVFNTAKAITAALVYPPPLNGLLTAAAIATGAAQSAVVLSQTPPKLHMGGMVSSTDERSAVLQTGEAVLDRTTVRSIGGVEGVRRLQNGRQSTDNVVIIQPFKHIDRYNKSARMMTPKRVGSGGY